MNAIIKQLFCVEENGVSRVSITKVGTMVKMASGAVVAMAGTVATQGSQFELDNKDCGKW